MTLWNVLGLDKKEFPQVIVIVGSGGKTSLMGHLAREGKEHNLRVAVLTTTHMRRPPGYQEAFSDMKEGSITIFGKESPDEKITYPGDDCYERICEQADLILVEADGSRGFPIKYPAAHEPVIPANTNQILCICGMSGLDKPAAEVCHRWNLAVEVCQRWELAAEQGMAGIAGQEIVTESILVKLLEEGYGRPLQQKYPNAGFYYFLNQADDARLQERAKALLEQTGRKGVVLSLLGEENILYTSSKERLGIIYMASGFARRYGSNKLLEIIEEKPLYIHGLQMLKAVAEELETEQRRIELVVVSQYEEILEAARKMGCIPVHNPNSQEGITASIHLGIAAIPNADAYLFAVADQPWLRPESVKRLIEKFFAGDKTIACLAWGERRGNPVIFSAKYKEELLELKGDRGGSVVLKKHPEEVLSIPVSEKELEDVDVPGG